MGVPGLHETRNINMLLYPEPIKLVNAGEKLKLQWKYQINELEKSKWSIGLYEYNHISGVKTKLLVLDDSGIAVSNPKYLPLSFINVVDMELSYDKAGISISNTTFDSSIAGYGIVFHSRNGNITERHFEQFTEITVSPTL